jgi:hypothetical protein
MSMTNVDLFTNQYLSDYWKRLPESPEGYIACYCRDLLHMVAFKPISHVSDAGTTVFELISEECNLVASF